MDSLAYIGGVILALQAVPQIYKILKRKSAFDLSYMFLMMNIIGQTLVVVYAIYNRDTPLYSTVMISEFNTCVMLVLKIYFDRK